MARMSREFSLVLVGSGILTAGYFLYPEEDLQAKQDEKAHQQIAGNNHHHRSHYYGPGFLWIHTGFGAGYGGSTSRPVATGGAVSRGGFGSIGRGSAGG
ncbi:MAG TPA: hypothetical protein VM597_21945 [Gemmataceae bacterium]|jgi:hypothetical protein|nr:hypothetical protein [Gemmataceae bacterium]